MTQGSAREPAAEALLRSRHPVDLSLTLWPLRRGISDPCVRAERSGVWWRATRTPQGAATTRFESIPDRRGVHVRAWGEGAEWAVAAAPELLGLGTDPAAFDPAPGLIRTLHHRMPGLRITRSLAVFEAIVPSIIEQKIAGASARRSYRSLVRSLGEPAPGPAGLMLPPPVDRLATTPTFEFHPLGIEMRRAGTIREAARKGAWLDRLAALPNPEASLRMQALPGIGPWTAAEVAIVALGDQDAVSVGDYHLPNMVAWALAREPRGDDARMLELLEPYRGYRGLALRLLSAAGIEAPRFGPRMPLQPIERI